MKLLVSPHNDDAVLFASFTILRERPTVVTIFDSFLQVTRGHLRCTADVRRAEDVRALGKLGADPVFAGYRDDLPYWPGIEEYLAQYGDPEEVFAPAIELHGHTHHNRIGDICCSLF